MFIYIHILSYCKLFLYCRSVKLDSHVNLHPYPFLPTHQVWRHWVLYTASRLQWPRLARSTSFFIIMLFNQMSYNPYFSVWKLFRTCFCIYWYQHTISPRIENLNLPVWIKFLNLFYSSTDLRNYWTEFHETWWSYRYMFLVGPKVFSFVVKGVKVIFWWVQRRWGLL
jgi:hypothetical protein